MSNNVYAGNTSGVALNDMYLSIVIMFAYINSIKYYHQLDEVDDYNKYMIGVDKSDQQIATYNVLIKSIRWWKCLFFHAIDVSVVNSFILFQQLRNQHPDAPEFQRPNGNFCTSDLAIADLSNFLLNNNEQ